MGGYSVASNWRWPFYETLIMSVLVLLALPFLPETSPSTILLNRAKRLRKATGNNSYLAPCELNPVPLGLMLKEALSKPVEISIKDPAIAYACIYSAIIYSTYYSFFEAFPILYLDTYHLSLGGLGLIFLSIIVGCGTGVVVYWSYLRYVFIPEQGSSTKTKASPSRRNNGFSPAWSAHSVPQ